MLQATCLIAHKAHAEAAIAEIIHHGRDSDTDLKQARPRGIGCELYVDFQGGGAPPPCIAVRVARHDSEELRLACHSAVEAGT